MINRLFSSSDGAVWALANRYPELTAAIFGWVVLSPVARWLLRALS